MSQVTIEVNGRPYVVGCEDGQERRLTELAAQLDAQVRQVAMDVGPLGETRPVSGTWREGYLELSFAGEWPKDSRQGAPGPVNVFLAGWIDGEPGKGRMRVEGRSDGSWTATKK